MEYGDKDFTYDEKSGELSIKLVANTLIKVHTPLDFGEEVDGETLEMWLNKRTPSEGEMPFKSITLKWNFDESKGSSKSTREFLNEALVEEFVKEVVDDFINNPSGIFTHTQLEGEKIDASYHVINHHATNLFTIDTHRFAIKEKQAMLWVDSFVIGKSKDINSPGIGAGVCFDDNSMIKKLIIPFENYYCTFSGDQSVNGTMEFTYVY